MSAMEMIYDPVMSRRKSLAIGMVCGEGQP